MTDGEGVRRSQSLARAYRAAWMLTAGAAVSAGLVAALFFEVPVSPVGVFIGGATLSVALVLPFAEQPSRRPMRWVELALAGGVAAVAVQGLATWIGWWTVLVLVVLAGGSPWVTAALPGLTARPSADVGAAAEPARTTAPSARTPEVAAGPVDMSLYEVLLEEVETEPADDPADESHPELRALDVEQLCRRWLGSFARLREAPTPELVLAVTRERDAMLRELTRRDPDGVAAWLADGPRATGDPRRYLRRTQDG